MSDRVTTHSGGKITMCLTARSTVRFWPYLVMTAALAGISCTAALADTTATLSVEIGKPDHDIPTNFFGLMTEEINHSYDGGLYAELIQNRIFKDDKDKPVH